MPYFYAAMFTLGCAFAGGMLVILAAIVWEFIVAFFQTISFLRWQFRGMKRVGREPKWKRLPGAIFRLWWDFAAHGKGVIHSDNGWWSGIGRHVLYARCKLSTGAGVLTRDVAGESALTYT